MTDLSGDLYKLMDEAGLSGATIVNPSKPINKIINDIRTKLAQDLKDYIENNYRERGE